MRKITALILAAALGMHICGCKKIGKPDDNDSIVVLEENTDIKLAVSNIDTFNPLETASKSIQSIMNIVYEPLFTYDDKINAVPVLAKSYKLSEDGRRITVRLRDGVKWHDGTNFTAEDVVYTLSKLVRSNGLYKKTAEKIAGFTALSKNEVQINLNSQELDFAYELTFPVLSKNTRYKNNADFIPIGTGSYRFGEKRENEIIFDPNPLWHGDAVPQKKIVIKLARDNLEAAQAFNVNETDAILSEEADGAGYALKSNAQTRDIVSGNLIFLGFNTENPMLTPEVRRAIGLSMDKEKILKEKAYGYGRVCDISVNPDSWAYEGVASGEYSQDYIVKMLESRGYKLVDGVYSNGGQAMSFEILVNSDNDQRRAMAEAIAEMLSGAGFPSRVNAVSYNSYLEHINSGFYDMFVGEAETDSVIDPLALLDSGKNLFLFDASELKELRNGLYGERDKDDYKNKIKKIAAKFTENPPYIPLFFTTRSVIYGADVSGITQPTLTDRYKDIEKWYFYSTKTDEDEEKLTE